MTPLKHKMMKCMLHMHCSGMRLLKFPLSPHELWAFPRKTLRYHPVVVCALCVAQGKLRFPSTWKSRDCYPTLVPTFRRGRCWDPEFSILVTVSLSQPWQKVHRERIKSKSKWGGFLSAASGVRVWGGHGDLCPTVLPVCHGPFCTSLALHTWAMT